MNGIAAAVGGWLSGNNAAQQQGTDQLQAGLAAQAGQMNHIGQAIGSGQSPNMMGGYPTPVPPYAPAPVYAPNVAQSGYAQAQVHKFCPLGPQKFLESQGWKVHSTGGWQLSPAEWKFTHEKMPGEYSWHEAMAVEFYKFMSIGGVVDNEFTGEACEAGKT